MAIEIEIDEKNTSDSTDNELPMNYYFYLLSFIGSLVLILLQPFEAAAVTTTHGWYSQPFVAPLFGLSIISIFSGTYLLVNTKKNFHCLKNVNPIELSFNAVSKYRTAIIISMFFYLFIASLSVVGFAISSFVLIISMLWISNLFNRFWVVMSLISVSILIVIFRVIVSVWLPDVWLYNLFPDSLSEFANMYL
ncbi:hypothetical protein MT391_17675 [Vibrio sp. 1-Bac 57]|uniref:hypothetical protein n=1 Tax=Psychromonas arctica TaxID=168275 RepID=UPI0003F97D59|nr:hypothetical protein [Psychromonas arctica]